MTQLTISFEVQSLEDIDHCIKALKALKKVLQTKGYPEKVTPQ